MNHADSTMFAKQPAALHKSNSIMGKRTMREDDNVADYPGFAQNPINSVLKPKPKLTGNLPLAKAGPIGSGGLDMLSRSSPALGGSAPIKTGLGGHYNGATPQVDFSKIVQGFKPDAASSRLNLIPLDPELADTHSSNGMFGLSKKNSFITSMLGGQVPNLNPTSSQPTLNKSASITGGA